MGSAKMSNSSLLNAGGKKDEGSVVADGLTINILENEELLTAHRLEKP